MLFSSFGRNGKVATVRPETNPPRRRSLRPSLEALEERLAPATRVWDGSSLLDSNWTTAANWVGDVAPIPGVDDLEFPSTAARKASTNDFVGAAFLGIAFTGSGYALAGNGLTLGGNLTTSPGTFSNFINLGFTLDADRTFEVGASSVLTINGVIADSGGAHGFTKAGLGTLVLRAANTYAGLTQLSESTVRIEHPSALGSPAGGTIIAKGASIRLINIPGPVVFPPEPLTFGLGPAGSGATLVNSVNDATWTGPVTFDPGENNVVAEPGRSLRFTGAIGGTGGFRQIQSGGVLEFAGTAPNTYAGLTEFARGTFRLNKPAGATAIPGALLIAADDANTVVTLMAANQIADSAAVTVAGAGGFFGTLNLNGFAETVGSLSGSGGHIFLGSGALTTGANNDSTIFDGDLTGTGSLTKIGTGLLRLEGNSFYTGTTRLVGPGSLEINGIQPSSPVVVDGGVLRGSGAIGTLTVNAGTVNPGAGTATGQLTVNGDVTFNAGSTYQVRLDGITSATQIDQIRVVGGSPRTVTINNASLDANIAFTAAGGTRLTLIENATLGATAGTGFAGIGQGALFTVTGIAPTPNQAFRMNYAGGDGDDVVITRNTPPMVQYILLDPQTIFAGDSTYLLGQLTDPDAEDFLGLSVSWGDGSAKQIEVPGLEPFAYSHQYDSPGEYEVLASWFDTSGEGNFRVLPLTVLPTGAPPRPGVPPVTSGPTASGADSPQGLTLRSSPVPATAAAGRLILPQFVAAQPGSWSRNSDDPASHPWYSNPKDFSGLYDGTLERRVASAGLPSSHNSFQEDLSQTPARFE